MITMHEIYSYLDFIKHPSLQAGDEVEYQGHSITAIDCEHRSVVLTAHYGYPNEPSFCASEPFVVYLDDVEKYTESLIDKDVE